LASTTPASMAELSRSRLPLREARKGEIADGIMAAVEHGQSVAPAGMPNPERSRERLVVHPALAALLRVSLDAQAAG